MKKFSKIREALSRLIEETFIKVTSDKGALSIDGEDVEVGLAVSIISEEGEETTAPDGDYTIEGGRILRIAEGRIVEIVEPEPETPAEEPENENPAPEENESEEPANEEPETENPTNTGEESDTEAIVKLREEVNELYELVHKLEDRIAELEKKPAAEPASEEFKKANEPKASMKDTHKSFLMDVIKA